MAGCGGVWRGVAGCGGGGVGVVVVWCGVGWGAIIASFAVRSHALAHIRHATLLYVLMHLHTYVMLRCCTNTRTAGFGDIPTCRKTWMSPKLCISLDVSLPPLEKWACPSAISRMINMQMMMMMMMMVMMMMMMKLLLMLKFRFSAFCGPPCKMFEK